MSSSLPVFSRRAFLDSCLVAGGAVAIQGFMRPGSAAQPIVRTGKPFMKLSLAAYSFHRYLPQNWPKPREGRPTMTLLDFVDFCAWQNLDACELTSYYFPASESPARELAANAEVAQDLDRKGYDAPTQVVPDDFLRQIKERTFRLGLDISGTAIGNDFCLPDGSARDFQLQMTRQWIDYAAAIGAPVIRIFAGNVPKGDTEAVALDRCVAGINQSVEYAASKGVVLALENHGGITATPEQLLAIVQRVDDSPWFGVNFDGGNFHTPDPYAALEQIAPYAVNAQLKVSIHPEGGERQRADLGRMVEILKQAGYRGYVVLEYEEQDDPHTAIPPILSELRSLVAV